MSPLVLKNVSKSFGGLHALSNLSLSIDESELRAVIGPNGAGKTTLFNVINGQLRPSAGEIHLFGIDVTRKPCYQRAYLGLGRTFQITSIFPNLTLLDNLCLALQAQKSMKFVLYQLRRPYKSLRFRAEEILEEWGFGDKREVFAKNLSHGEQRQIDVIIALAGEPKLLLLDEPTSGLSQVETNMFKNFIAKLRRDRTIIMIEHDMDVAFSLADRITVLNQGSIFADGSAEHIKSSSAVAEIYLGDEED